MSKSFSDLEKAPDDAIFGLVTQYRNDPNEKKVNLSVGAYRTDKGLPYVLEVVKKAELIELENLRDGTTNKEYLPIDGLPAFHSAAAKIIFGADSPLLEQKRVATVQALSGTGSLRLAFDFIHDVMEYSGPVYASNPTWGNHKAIVEKAGLSFDTYTYITDKMTFDFEGMLNDIKTMETGSVILLHTCAHNPTGVDPTHEQWDEILAVVKEMDLLPVFDTAYQGFATGSLDNDAYSIRHAAEIGLSLLVCQSFSKNLGLYNERTGALHVLCDDEKAAIAVKSHIKKLIRPMYSNPPRHGATLVATILNSNELFDEWVNEMEIMSTRMKKMRHLLVDSLNDLGTPGDWDHILSQVGMFSFTGLSVEVCDALREKHHIYMLRNGRISLAGLSTANCAYLTQCIHQELSGEAASEESIEQVRGRCNSLKHEVDYEDSSKVTNTFEVVTLPQLQFKA